jgi:hypothetical protein
VKPKDCDLCGRKNSEDGGHLNRWGSWLLVMPFGKELSVCPSCRDKPINDMYRVLMEREKVMRP